MIKTRVLGLCLATAAFVPPALAQEGFRTKEARSLGAVEVSRLEPKTILLVDQREDPLAASGNGLLKFEDWERSRPAQKQLLALFPSYVEPTYNVTLHGVTRVRKEKLSMYVVEARFLLDKAPSRIDLARYATRQFVERIDPAIRHQPIAPGDIVPVKDPEATYMRHPDRAWCTGPGAVCLQSRYQLEGKLPMGIRLANKLEEGGKKVAEVMEFQSELRPVPTESIDQAALQRLTGLSTPVTGALEQNIFYVNQIMRFGKFLAVFQPQPDNPNKTVVTSYIALAVKTDVLDRKKEYERVPVLRNLVPAQVLVGKSSFNTGNSLSAGLPDYARNQLRAVAEILERE